MSLHRGSNSGPFAYEANALPLSHRGSARRYVDDSAAFPSLNLEGMGFVQSGTQSSESSTHMEITARKIFIAI